jgi:NADPH2:quinone reductase
MRAAVLTELGVPRAAEWPEPVPAAAQAVVEVLAAGLNPLDVTSAAGGFRDGPPPLPSVTGLEGVGLLDGRRVYFGAPLPPHGSMAQRTLVDPGSVMEVPDGVDDASAVAVGIAGLAAWLALGSRGRLRSGEHVLILGSGGAVGQIAVQAARLLGAGRVVAASRSAEGRELSRTLGADATVPLYGDPESMAGELREAAVGRIDVVVDLLWGAPIVAAMRAASAGARIVHVGQSAGGEAALSGTVLRGGMLELLGFSVAAFPREARAAAFRTLLAHVAASELTLRIRTMRLERVREAWAMQQAGPRCKLVIVP